MIYIDTEYGPANVWWDAESDPDNPGWVLSYHLEPADSPQALGRRHLTEPLNAPPGDEAAAAEAGLRVLAGMRVGGGRQCTSVTAAKVAGLGSAGSWRRRAGEWSVPPDGHYDRRTPWWWETTIMAARAARPGQGVRTDLR